MYFPNDAISVMYAASGAGTGCATLLPATTTAITVLHAEIRSSNTGGAEQINIGAAYYLKSWDREVVKNAPVLVSNENITCTRGSGDIVDFSIVYVPYDLRARPDPVTIISYASGTAPMVSGGFTYGELINSTLLLLIFSVALYSFFLGVVRGHKIRL